MSDSLIVIIALMSVAVGIIAVIKNRLKYKKSIIFYISSVIMFPILVAAVLGVIVGARGLIHFVWAAPLLLIVTTIIHEINARLVQKPLKDTIKTLKSLSAGDVDVVFYEKLKNGEHEMAQVMQEMDKLTDTLKKIVDFADHVGKGNLNVEYTLKSEKDALGFALLNMQVNLQKAEIEKQERQLEDDRRSWTAEGHAKFSELLRANNDNMEELCYSIVSNLVKYVGANQGGIFLMNETGEKPVLELKACYAYERRKFSNKTINMGEGLLSVCFLERQSIYMTDIPNNYINITSGLGEGAPRALFIAPLKVNEDVCGVVEIAGFEKFEPHVREFVEKLSESIAATISAVRVNMRTSDLLEQSKLQSEQLASQEEELRQNMEEMQATQEEMQKMHDKLQNENSALLEEIKLLRSLS